MITSRWLALLKQHVMEINYVSLHVPVRVAHADQIEDAEFEEIQNDGQQQSDRDTERL
jgi:hypothetical protein